MHFRNITQAVSFGIFFSLFAIAAYPPVSGAVEDIFLRLDPIIALGTMIASRQFLIALVPGIIVIVTAVIAGRFFCGHMCPMGTTLDLGEIPLRSRRRASESSYEATSDYRSWKYVFLAIILAGSASGVLLVHLGSPISLVTRFFALVVQPLGALLADAGLAATAPVFDRLGLVEIAYAQVPYRVFAANAFIAALFLGLFALAVYRPRFWCRNLCPAGALLALSSWKPLIRRRVDESCTRCGQCIRACPTGAIRESPEHTVHSECIVCLRCVEICPEQAIAFQTWDPVPVASAGGGPSRRAVLAGVGTGLITAGIMRTAIAQPREVGKNKPLVPPELIRPPGALPEPQFLNTCVRCGLCMRACPTNTIQPIWLDAGLEGLFSPVILPRLAGCAVKCNVCGDVCPTGAIRDLPLEEKNHAKIGTAYVIREHCLVWEQDRKCLVCDEVCPYNALSFRAVPGRKNAAPFVLEHRCIGCGWCETHCPVQGSSAIRVNVIGQVRLASGSYEQKAREFGLVFQDKDNSRDRLAPETFDVPGKPGVAPKEKPQQQPEESPLPPGFILK